jgi:secreted PhoX family phosphatase
MQLDRRTFTATSLATIAFSGATRVGASQAPQEPTYRNEVPGYGPLKRDPAGLFDLPEGFTYTILSSAGEAMDDGFATPDKFDGMGCHAIDANRVALVRNHELKPGDEELGPSAGLARLEQRLKNGPAFGRGRDGRVLPGGTSTIIIDLRTLKRETQWLSLAGTAVNCAGGNTPWGSWLTCEETMLSSPDVERAHGWIFEVPSYHRGLVEPKPLTGMGRFRHEAAAVDKRTGIFYLTEDTPDGLFMRFIPDKPGNLAAGGRLQALAIEGLPGMDTRNWDRVSFTPGAAPWARWVDLDAVDNPADDLRNRGRAVGAAIFARGEGIHAGNNELYFTCTSGGAKKLGQIFRYIPSPFEGHAGERERPGRLQLFLESRDASVLEYGDNLIVAPNGHLIVCEDRTDGKPNHLRGVTPEGRVYTLALLRADTELAGVCFAPDGRTMFVNVYRPGRTLAIRGPWSTLSLT